MPARRITIETVPESWRQLADADCLSVAGCSAARWNSRERAAISWRPSQGSPVKYSEDVQELVGLASLGWIPRLKGYRVRRAILRLRGGKGRSEIYRLVTLLYPRSAAAEAYRTLRANIEFAAVDAPIRTLLVASAIPGEGKTVTAANLAVVFAQAGHRVLLVDADFRKPGVHLIFDLANARGLTTLLRSDDAILVGSKGAGVARRHEEPISLLG